MKVALILLVICAAILFVPRYDLYGQESEWSDKLVLREQGFWTAESCRKAGVRMKSPYHCVGTNTWSSLWGNPVGNRNEGR